MDVRRGFTLIELLVVIAIIAILAAILFPVFARAREKARQTGCLSNVKQMTLGMLFYAQDYDERFPITWSTTTPTPGHWYYGPTYYAQLWRDQIYPYVKNYQVFTCPSDTSTERSYMMNAGLNSNWGENGSGVSLGTVVSPAECVAVCEGGGDYHTKPSWIVNYPTSCGLITRHNEGQNVGLCDGHAKWYKPRSIWDGTTTDLQKYWDPAK